MRCFTYHGGQLTNGIKTTLSKTQKRLIFLGAKGYNCERQLVFFDRKSYPEVDENGIVSFAYPAKRKFVDKGKDNSRILVEKVVLKRAYPSQTKALLRINTSTPSAFPINGRWEVIKGDPIIWVNSHGFHRSIRGGQVWVDDLLTIDDCDIILVIPAGGGKEDRKIIYDLKGEIGCIPEIGYEKIIEKIKYDQIMTIPLECSKQEADAINGSTEEIEPQRSESTSADVEMVNTIDSEENGKAPDDTETVIHEDSMVSTLENV